MGTSADELRQAWGGEELPGHLRALADLQDASEGFIVCDFELSPRAQQQVAAALGVPDEAAQSSLRMFGRDGMHSLYGLWRAGEATPIVYVSGEGVSTGVIAASLDDFLALLAAGKEAVGWIDQWSAGECPGVEKYRDWLEHDLGLAPAGDPRGLVERARAGSPSFDEWLEAQRS